MEQDRRILSKINYALEIAEKTEKKIKRKNSNLIIPLKNTCELFQEKKEINDIFLKELSIFNIYKYPSTIKRILLKKFKIKNIYLKKDENAFCRAGIMTLFLHKTNSLNKYIKTHVNLTTYNEECLNRSILFSKIIKVLLNGNKLNKKELIEIINNKNLEKNFLKEEKIDKIFNTLKENKEIYISLYSLLKYKNNYEEAVLELKKLKNENILFAYGLMYGLSYYEREKK